MNSATRLNGNMRIPDWEDLEAQPEQLAVLEHPLDRPLFDAGPPGLGKTVFALRRAQAAAQTGDISSVPVVTLNRMLRRLLKLMNDGETGSEPPGQKEHECDWKHSAGRRGLPVTGNTWWRTRDRTFRRVSSGTRFGISPA